MEQCAVCGKEVDPAQPAGISRFQAQSYVFCCKECKQQFDQCPQTYAKQAAA